MGKNFKIIFVIFETSTLKFVYLQNITKKQKLLNLRSKMPYLGIFDQESLFWYFWARIKKNYCLIWNQHPQICLIENFAKKKKKKIKYGSKNALFGYFPPIMSYLGIFGLTFCHTCNQQPLNLKSESHLKAKN